MTTFVMEAAAVVNSWQTAFGPVAPAAHLCREAMPERWVRIHSLPESKRYPENDGERDEVVRRHLIVAQAQLKSAACRIFWFRYGLSTEPPKPEWLGSRSLSFMYHDALSVAGDDQDEGSLQIFSASIQPDKHNLPPIILSVTEEEIPSVLIADFAHGTAYAPYDGGADLFFPSGAMAMKARETWVEWLSSHPSGL